LIRPAKRGRADGPDHILWVIRSIRPLRPGCVRVQADTAKQKRPFAWVDDEAQSQGFPYKNRELLPSHIFAYYSGRNDRIEGLFQEHQRRFNRRQEIVAEEVLPAELLENFTGSEADIRAMEEARKRERNRFRQLGDDRLRRLFAPTGGHLKSAREADCDSRIDVAAAKLSG
jgi:hypothetical protein